MSNRTKHVKWNDLIRDLPQTHLLQTSQWADLKVFYGWEPYFLIWEKAADSWDMRVYMDAEFESGTPAAAGLILERKALPGLRVLYMPKGPLLADWTDQALSEKVLDDLVGFARQKGALQIKIDPDLEFGQGVPGDENYQVFDIGERFQAALRRKGWIFSQEQIQFRNTVLVDLREDEDQILARMKSKTRYNIRLSGRKGIQIRLGEENRRQRPSPQNQARLADTLPRCRPGQLLPRGRYASGS